MRSDRPDHRWGTTLTKRLFDAAVSAGALAVLAPVLALIALSIKLDSRGPVLFRQLRVGRRFRPFTIYKFRTMVPAGVGAQLTCNGDPRVTRVGRVLRQSKLDELPQLWNVLRGDMSFVGPRPEVGKYVELFRDDYRDILEVRPGITDLASLRYRNEAALLGDAAGAEGIYLRDILPDKIRLSREYVQRASMKVDLALILKTVFSGLRHDL